MANDYLFQFRMGYEQKPVSIFAKIAVGASGALTLNVPASKGIKSVARNSAGDWTITLKSKFARLMNVKYVVQSGSAAPAAPGMYIKADAVAASGTVEIVMNSAGTATDPANGEIIMLEIVCANSGY